MKRNTLARLLITVSSLCMVSVFLCAFVSARVVKSWYVEVDGISPRNTSSVLKYNNGNAPGGDLRCEFDHSDNVSGKINLDGKMYNSDNSARSGQFTVAEGTTKQVTNSGSSGYSYHLTLWREYWYDPDVSCYGSWSPDTY